MKKFKGFFAGVRVVATCFIIALAIAMVGCDKQPLHDPSHDSSSTSFDLQASEVISIWKSLDAMGSKKDVENLYHSQKALIKEIANFVLQYPTESNEYITISNYDEIRISLHSLNKPSVDLTAEADNTFLPLIKQLLGKKNFSSIYSNIGNSFVIFMAEDTGLKMYNGVVIVDGETLTKKEVEAHGTFEVLGLFEQIEEGVYYFEAQ